MQTTGETGMRRDWDFVEFADYKSDMDELSSQAALITGTQRREIDGLKRAIAAIVKAAGGRVKVSDYDLHQLPGIELEWLRHEYDNSTTFLTRERTDG